MKSILVPIGGSTTDEPVLETALAAARPFAAHLQFLHIRVGLGETAQYTPHMAFASGAALRGALEELEVQNRGRCAAAVEHIHDFCTRSQIEPCDAPNRSRAVTAKQAGKKPGARSSGCCFTRATTISWWSGAPRSRTDCRRISSSFCSWGGRASGPDRRPGFPTDGIRHHHGVLERKRRCGPRRNGCGALPGRGPSAWFSLRRREERGRRIRSARCRRSICLAWRSGRGPGHRAERPSGAGTAGERRPGLRRRSDRVGRLRSLAPARDGVRRLHPVLHPPLRSTGLVDALGVGLRARAARHVPRARRPAPRPQEAYG